MAYNKENLRLKQTVGDFYSEFVYKADEALSAVQASGYFNDAITDYGLKDGDVVCVLATDASAFVKVSIALENATTTLFKATAGA